MSQRSHYQRATTAASFRAGRDRWLISYADLVTLLFACFTTAYAATQVPSDAVDANASAVPLPMAVRESENEAPPQSIRELVAPIVATLDERVEMTEDVRGLVITLPESATFPTASATLTEDARQFLGALATTLRPTSAALRIEGHTDDVPLTGGRYGSNWELSTARASAVVLYLINDASFAPARLSAAGYGEFRPRVPNDTPEQRALNRRVEVVVIERAEGAHP